MEKDFKNFNLVGQYPSDEGNAAGKRDVIGVFVITGSDGEKREVEITDCQDNLAVEKLMPRAKTGDDSAIRHLASIIKKYDPFATARLLLRTGDYGEAWEVAADCWDELAMEEDAFRGYRESAKYDHPCGKCKLGCYYAQGKGCKKNKALAKKWLEEAAQMCPDAEKYLDQYGLR